MNSKAALCIALLRGEVVSIRTGFLNLSITNVPREIGRSIERESEGGFGVIISRTKKEGKSKYGVPCTWIEYRLPRTEYNAKGIEKMKEYVQQHLESNPKTSKQFKQYKQVELILK